MKFESGCSQSPKISLSTIPLVGPAFMVLASNSLPLILLLLLLYKWCKLTVAMNDALEFTRLDSM